MKDLIPLLNELYTSVTTSKKSDFYQKLYGSNRPTEINSLADWHSLPALTRHALQTTPLWERIFVPIEDVVSFRISSGSSGHGFLVSPKLSFDDYDRYMQLTNRTKAAIVFLPNLHIRFETLAQANDNRQLIGGDFSDIEGSIQLAKHISVDCIQCYSFMINTLTPYAQKHSLTSQIKCLVLFGERISTNEYAEVQKNFPNAQIRNYYAASELPTQIGSSPHGSNTHSYLSPTKPHYWEVLDENNMVLTEQNSEGILHLTTLPTEPLATPMLRYNTGDRVRIAKVHADHWQFEFELLGREGIDIIKLNAGQLRVNELERVLTEIDSASVLLYELHFYHGDKPRVEIHFSKPIKDILTEKNSTKVAEQISEKLRMSPTLTYAEAVEQNLYHPLTVHITPVPQVKNKKRQRFIQHYPES